MNEKEKQEIFLELLERFRKQLSGYIRALTKNSEDAKDIMSDTILVAWSGFDKINNIESLKSYMFTVATRKIKHFYYKKKLFGLFDTEQAEQIIDKSANPDRQYDVEVLYKAMSYLPEKQKQALTLFEISGFSIEEIKKVQGGTISGVKTRLKRAREFLKNYFENESKPVFKNKPKSNNGVIIKLNTNEENYFLKATNEYTN